MNSSLGLAGILLLSILLTAFDGVHFPTDNTSRGATLIFLLGFVFFLHRSRNLKMGKILINLILGITIPMRMYQSGEVSPIAFEFAFFCVLNYAILGARGGFLTLAYAGLIIFGFANFNEIDLLTIFRQRTPAISTFLILSLITIPIFHIVKEKDQLSERLLSWEQRRSSNVIMTRMSHEIGNSLQIILGHIGAYEKNKDNVDLKKAELFLNEIDNLVKGMAREASDGELVNLLEKHKKEIKILSKL